MNWINHYLYQVTLSTAVIIVFYYYTKSYVFGIAAKIAVSLKLTRSVSVEMAKGVIELPLVVLIHLLFCLLLTHFIDSMWVSGVKFNQLALDIPIGILLGIGMMSIASLLCRAIIELLRHNRKPYFPRQVKDWLIMTRSGWLRHYLHTIDILPLSLSFIIIFGQICCEEIVFRGVLLPYFLPDGYYTALMTATAFFMFMQLFHMPNWVSGIFPLVGSMVIGLINGVLFLKYFNLMPLIIAHFSFFVAAVL